MLTPIELQGKSFKTGFGYDKKDVEAFLKDVMKNYEMLYKENHELNDKIDVLSEGVQYYKSIEKTLQKALVLAEKAAQDTEAAAAVKADSMLKEAKANANNIEKTATRHAAEIIAEARAKAKEVVYSSKNELDRLQFEVSSLVKQYEQYKIQYRQLLQAQFELLESKAFNIDFSTFTSLKGEEAVDEQPEVVTMQEIQVEEESAQQEEIMPEEERMPEESVEERVPEQQAEPEEMPEVASVSAQEEAATEESAPSLDEDFIPVINLEEILREVEKHEKEQQAERMAAEEEMPEESYEEMIQEEQTAEEADLQAEKAVSKVSEEPELTEQELLLKLFASDSGTKKEGKPLSTNTDEEFEFLNI